MIPRSVCIVCDGGPHYGIGHMRRSMVVGSAFRDRGYRVRLEGNSSTASEFVRRFESDSGPFGIGIVDLPYDGDEALLRLHRSGIPVIGLDYIGAIAPDLSFSVMTRQGSPDAGDRYVGLEFSIVRQIRRSNDGTGGVLVSVGGADIQRLGPSVAQFLYDSGEDVTLVQGCYAPPLPAEPLPYRTFVDPPDFEMHLQRCQWAVTNGGTTMLELMSIGKAVHAIPQTPAEERLARQIFDRGGLLGVGMDGIRIPKPVDASTVGKMAHRLVDGRGVERIISLIESRY
jgi:spore coat polysaccharide biosynthesis predicted glycosyltransferase SpsG